MGGMQRSAILVHVFRNHKAEFEDDAVGICAGLWNFALSYQGTTLLNKVGYGTLPLPTMDSQISMGKCKAPD